MPSLVCTLGGEATAEIHNLLTRILEKILLSGSKTKIISASAGVVMILSSFAANASVGTVSSGS